MPEQLFISQGYQSGISNRSEEDRKTPGSFREGLCGGLELDASCACYNFCSF